MSCKPQGKRQTATGKPTSRKPTKKSGRELIFPAASDDGPC